MKEKVQHLAKIAILSHWQVWHPNQDTAVRRLVRCGCTESSARALLRRVQD